MVLQPRSITSRLVKRNSIHNNNKIVDNGNTESTLSVREQLELIFGDGGNLSCDYSDPNWKNTPDDKCMPPWYDDAKFKRGQKYVHENIFGMFTNHLCGLITLLSMSEGLPLLAFTGMSNTRLLSYRRYVGTIKHLLVWYSSSFEPKSEGWKSMIRVRKLHRSASRRGRKEGIKSISQRFMCLSQFGFMGYALIRPRHFGLSTESPEDIEAFVHFWRVIGWLLGIDDRYNICRSSVEETKQICEVVLHTVFRPATRSTDQMFIDITDVVLDSLWYIIPFIYKEPFMAFLYRVTEPIDEINQYKDLCKIPNSYVKEFKLDSDNQKGQQLSFTPYTRFIYSGLIGIHIKYRKNHCWKFIMNNFLYLTLFFMNYFPILAIGTFGYNKSYVNIIPDKTY